MEAPESYADEVRTNGPSESWRTHFGGRPGGGPESIRNRVGLPFGREMEHREVAHRL